MQLINLKTQHSAWKTVSIAIAEHDPRSLDEQPDHKRFASSAGILLSQCLVARMARLPMSGDLTEAEQGRVAAALRRAVSA